MLVPNTEFGHIEIRGKDAEMRASERAREVHDLDWAQWAGRVDEYMSHLEALLWPELFIVGGGVSSKSDKFLPLLERPARPRGPGQVAQRRRNCGRGPGRRLTGGARHRPLARPAPARLGPVSARSARRPAVRP